MSGSTARGAKSRGPPLLTALEALAKRRGRRKLRDSWQGFPSRLKPEIGLRLSKKRHLGSIQEIYPLLRFMTSQASDTNEVSNQTTDITIKTDDRHSRIRSFVCIRRGKSRTVYTCGQGRTQPPCRTCWMLAATAPNRNAYNAWPFLSFTHAAALRMVLPVFNLQIFMDLRFGPVSRRRKCITAEDIANLAKISAKIKQHREQHPVHRLTVLRAEIAG